jgi:hypothetical protein
VLSPGIRVHLANGTDEGFNVDDQTTVADIARHFGNPSAETPKVFLDGVALKDGRVLEVNPDRRPVYLKLCVFITFQQGPSRHEVEFAKGEEKASVAISRLADRLRVPESAISISQSPRGKALGPDEPLNPAKIYDVKLKDQLRVFIFRLKPNPSGKHPDAFVREFALSVTRHCHVSELLTQICPTVKAVTRKPRLEEISRGFWWWNGLQFMVGVP